MAGVGAAQAVSELGYVSALAPTKCSYEGPTVWRSPADVHFVRWARLDKSLLSLYSYIMRPRFQDLPPGYVPPQALRFKGGRGRGYVPDVVERVRVLVEGTTLSQSAIAARTGLGVTTIQRWTKRRGWTRPAGTSRWTSTIAVERAGLTSRFRDAFERVEALARRESERLAGIDGPAMAEGAARRLAKAARKAAERHAHAPCGGAAQVRAAPDDGRGPVRLSIRPPGPRLGRTRGDDEVALARELVERTTLTRTAIARRLGVSPLTLTHWMQAGGWMRPLDAPGPFGGLRLSPRWKERMKARTEAQRRLEEAEALLDALEREDEAGLDRIAAAFGLIEGARSGLRKSAGRARQVQPHAPDPPVSA